ncbi:zinc finger domain-containing protein [Streptomyces cyaneogriseus]|uniref:zinc finger domain-containing protein n=1 Tax=Streptomyces cyaneogriseus TaxID=68192 RepID=UPI003D18EC38
MTDPQAPSSSKQSDADEVERYACPKCDTRPGSPCRSRSGAVTSAYHTRRFTLVPRLKKALRVPPRPTAGRGSPGVPAPRRLCRSARICRARTSASATPAARPRRASRSPQGRWCAAARNAVGVMPVAVRKARVNSAGRG